MDTEKTETQTTKRHDNSPPDEKKTEKQPIADMVGDLVVSAATVIAHSAAEAVVNRVKTVAKKKAPKKPAATVAKKAKAVAKKVVPRTAKRGKKTKSPPGRKAVGKKKTAKDTAKKKKSKTSRR
jgi:hypothetical protein